MRLYIFEHPEYIESTIVVIASSEEHARSILEDSQYNDRDIRAEQFKLLDVCNISSVGVKYWSVG